jgi:hypothetical protein
MKCGTQQPPTFLTAVSRLSRNHNSSSLYSIGTDRIENTSPNGSGGARKYDCGLEGSQAVLARPSDICNVYNQFLN